MTLREKLAQELFKDKFPHLVFAPMELAICFEKASIYTALFRTEIEGLENPYPVTVRWNDPRYQDRPLHDGAEQFRQALLARLEEK